jgi:photosystem II stability/assembly factor-like uncharacterized protein
MVRKMILANTGRGIERAEVDQDGKWTVQQVMDHEEVSCLAPDPSDSQVIYAGTPGAGVLRSNDGGLTWKPIGMDGQIVKSLAVSPHDPNLIYAGTKPATVFTSQDGGKTWEELTSFRRIPNRWWWFSPAEPPDFRAYVFAIAVSPTEPEVLLAGIEFGAVIRSQDGGQTWSRHRSGALRDCHSLKFHAANGDWAYEAGGSGGGASYSRDGGITWRKAKGGLAKNYGVVCAADPAKPEVWYVAVAPGPGKAYGINAEAYLYRSMGGTDWQPIGWAAHPLERMPITLETDPKVPGHLYAGLTSGEIWHSIDYGNNWKKLPFTFKNIWRSLVLL